MPAKRLIEVVQKLSHAHDVDAIVDIVRVAARELTGADGATFVLRDVDKCYYVEENAISPLWKGRRFPLTACISGWVMLNGTPAVIEDIYVDPRIPAEAYRPTFVKSLVMVPVRQKAPIAAIGNYWATKRRPTDREVEILQALADSTSVAMENAELYGQLQAKIATLGRREARIREQRDALEVFTRSLAHDLKEPVRAIRSFAQLMIEEPRELDDVKAAERIRNAGDRMAMLIDTVFRYTQLDDPERLSHDEFNLAHAVETAVENLSALIAERGASVVREDLPVVTADLALLAQVFENLISNAVGHNPGPVEVRVSAERTAGGVRICVADNGSGIRCADQEHIFEPFRRLTHDKSHAGLGLAVCRKIVALHGGAIECRSEPGRGASFYFTVPDELPVIERDLEAVQPHERAIA
ncbi:MAG: GAF domain-containing protein [Alphaproteobacteria bacterium]|nr:GAF domain-containing protein [Alphaproteobacteria bacterium]